MSCPECSAAAERSWHVFQAGCAGCCARAASRSPQFSAARKEGKITREYRALLEQFGLTHEQVKAAASADAISKTNRSEASCET